MNVDVVVAREVKSRPGDGPMTDLGSLGLRSLMRFYLPSRPLGLRAARTDSPPPAQVYQEIIVDAGSVE